VTLRDALRDLVGLAGLAAVTFGCGMIYVPAGLIVGGLLTVAIAVMASRSA
jgi:hypothetical protein